MAKKIEDVSFAKFWDEVKTRNGSKAMALCLWFSDHEKAPLSDGINAQTIAEACALVLVNSPARQRLLGFYILQYPNGKFDDSCFIHDHAGDEAMKAKALDNMVQAANSSVDWLDVASRAAEPALKRRAEMRAMALAEDFDDWHRVAVCMSSPQDRDYCLANMKVIGSFDEWKNVDKSDAWLEGHPTGSIRTQ